MGTVPASSKCARRAAGLPRAAVPRPLRFNSGPLAPARCREAAPFVPGAAFPSFPSRALGPSAPESMRVSHQASLAWFRML